VFRWRSGQGSLRERRFRRDGILGFPPVDGGHDLPPVNLVLITQGQLNHVFDFGFIEQMRLEAEEQMRLEAEIEQLGMDDIVVVVFRLDPRVADAIQHDIQAQALTDPLHPFCQVFDREPFGDLVKDAEFPGGGR